MRATLAVLVLMAACKSGPEPSPEYAEGKKLFDAAYAEKQDECYDDFRVEEAEGHLRKVPKESSDYAATLILLKKIVEGRKELAESRAEEAAANQREPEAPAPSFEASGGGDAPAPAAAPLASDVPLGAALEVFTGKYAGCVEKKMPFQEQGGSGKSGDAWGVTAGKEEECAKSFPELRGQYYLFADGKLVRPVAAGEATVTTLTAKPDAGAE